MTKLLAVFSIVVIVTCYVTCQLSEEKCDHSFGYPNWKYSYVYYNQTQIMKAGTNELKVQLPRNPGDMISYVCVRAPSLPPHSTRASFSALHSTLTLTASSAVLEDTEVFVLAKKHGY